MRLRNKEIYISFYLVIFFCIINIGCSTAFKPPPDTITLWEKENIKVNEKIQTMLNCGYPSVIGSEGIHDKNKIALMHLCMEKHGFKYTGKYGTFCQSYPILSACVEAAAAKKVR